MKKIILLLLFAFAALLITGGSAAKASLVENGGFEAGLASWNHSPNVEAKGSWANIDPIIGDRQAVMSPFGFMPSSLSQDFEVETNHSLSISFDYNLWAFSFLESKIGDDLVVSLTGDDSAYFDEILRINFKDTISRLLTPTIQGWQHYEETFQFDTPMELSLLFELDNFKDLGQFSTAFIDNIEVSHVPVPTSLLLLGSGLCYLVGLRRKKE